MIRRWTFVLGAVGGAATLLCAIFLNDDLLLAVVTSILFPPLGAALSALLGALLGAILRMAGPSPAAERIALTVAAATLAAFIAYSWIPEPVYRADLVDVEILACKTPAEMRGAKEDSLAYWRDFEIRRGYAGKWKPFAWDAEFDKALASARGIFIETRVRRTKQALRQRAPWNRDSLTAGAWTPRDDRARLFVHAASCAAYPADAAAIRAVDPELETWPPFYPPQLLRARVAEPAGQEFARLVAAP